MNKGKTKEKNDKWKSVNEIIEPIAQGFTIVAIFMWIFMIAAVFFLAQVAIMEIGIKFGMSIRVIYPLNVLVLFIFGFVSFIFFNLIGKILGGRSR